MKKPIVISSFLVLSALLAFGQNESTVKQENGVTMSTVKVEQIGDQNLSLVTQNAGTKLKATISQQITGDYSRVSQLGGSENTAKVEQIRGTHYPINPAPPAHLQNHSEVVQKGGSGNKATVLQAGIINESKISQVDAKNSLADVYQYGGKTGTNKNAITQTNVVENRAIVEQNGTWGNESTIDQKNGKMNFAKVLQHGNMETTSKVLQDGNNNTANIKQDVNRRSESQVRQLGDGNNAKVTQLLSKSLVNNSGGLDSGPSSDIYQSGKSQTATVWQSEIENSFSEIDQYNQGNKASVKQHEGALLESTIWTNGKFNTVNVDQSGAGQVSTVSQVGNNNVVNVIQSNLPTP